MTAAPDFWSRRKAMVEAEAREAEPPETAPDERTEPEILAELGLPDPETLTMGDDFAAFMHRTVPDALRKKALRQLWRSNPVLANMDGLIDYGEDYTGKGTKGVAVQTSYQVGKGLLKHIEALARDTAPEPAPENAVVAETEAQAEAQAEDISAEPAEPQPPEAVPAQPATASLRMRFKYGPVSGEDA